MTEWGPDVLGAGFECTVIELTDDTEGPCSATLVRALPEPRRLWDRLFGREREFEHCDVLYVHGWSDYFFQKNLAGFFTERGARFFALDLRKYGRSLREGQTPGYIEDLTDYDEEIDAALQIIRPQSTADAASGTDAASEGGAAQSRRVNARKLVLFGHSTGGLVLSLWANRHPGIADAVVLNSPWLELQLSGGARRAMLPAVNIRARFTPHEIALPQLDMGFYSRAQHEWNPPEQFTINADWRPDHAMPVRAAWLRAILAGHGQIDHGIDVGAPVCVLLSRRSAFGLSWHDDMLRADTVLEVEGIARAALKLGPSVTVERIEGALHDVFLSEPSVREYAFDRLERWLRGWQAGESQPRN